MSLLNKTAETSSAKPKKLKNQLLWKRGGFAVAITVLLIAAVIVINAFAMPVLSGRFHMNYDFSKEKTATLSKDNLKFIKDVKDEVTVTVCAPEDQYVSSLQNVAYSRTGGVSQVDDTSYFEQTLTLIKKYQEYNKKIKVEFAESEDILGLYQQYGNNGLQNYGDIIVRSDKSKDRIKVLNFADIFTDNSEDLMYAMYSGQSTGDTQYTISENKIETALSGAIYYVLGGEAQEVALYTRGDDTAKQLANYLSAALKENNYEVQVIDDVPVTSISDKVSLAVLLPGQSDLIASELDTFTKYLDNGKKLGKNLVYFGTSVFDYKTFPNLTKLLNAWGITPENGMILDTTGNFYSTEYNLLVSSNDYTKLTENYLSTYNEGFTVKENEDEKLTVAERVDSADKMSLQLNGKKKPEEGKTKAYPIVVRMQKTATADDENATETKSTFTVFSSMDFAYPDMYTSSGFQCNNRDLLMNYFSAAMGSEESKGIDFGFKQVTAERFVPEESQINLVSTVFVWLIPLATLAAGIIVYVRRKQSK